MTNYRLTVQYDGTDYHGFQVQPDVPTIQGELEKAIASLGTRESPLYAAGRTDAGVHARGQVVNFLGDMKPGSERLPAALNSLLPPDIVITNCQEMEEGFNARHSAIAREYVYYMSLEEYASPFDRRFSYHCGPALDLEPMAAALELLAGTHDFAAFCRREEGRSTVREVQQADLFVRGRSLAIRIRANAFAWMMMRMIAGSLLQVGKGRWTLNRFQEVLESRDSSLCAPALPPAGLILEKVYY